MATNEEIETAIRESAESGVDSVSVNGLSAREMSLKERLDALDRLKSQTSAAQKHFGLRITQLVSPRCGG